MAKAKANHLNIDDSANSGIMDARKPRDVVLSASPNGGFTVSGAPADYGRTHGAAAAFSTLDEALDWLRVNMAQPAKDAAP